MTKLHSRTRGGVEITGGVALLIASLATGGAGGGAFLVIGMFVALTLIGTGCAHAIGEPSER